MRTLKLTDAALADVAGIVPDTGSNATAATCSFAGSSGLGSGAIGYKPR
jgi:hypothetical protein